MSGAGAPADDAYDRTVKLANVCPPAAPRPRLCPPPAPPAAFLFGPPARSRPPDFEFSFSFYRADLRTRLPDFFAFLYLLNLEAYSL